MRKAACKTVRDADAASAEEERADISTYTFVEDGFTVILEIPKGPGPFRAAELDFYGTWGMSWTRCSASKAPPGAVVHRRRRHEPSLS
jgi:hypothetical protein